VTSLIAIAIQFIEGRLITPIETAFTISRQKFTRYASPLALSIKYMIRDGLIGLLINLDVAIGECNHHIAIFSMPLFATIECKPIVILSSSKAEGDGR
jgi:hypothetical protein